MTTEMTVTDWPVAAPGGAARSRLAEDLEIDGVVISSGPIDVLGGITGAVRAPDVLIAAGGRIEGQVTALALTVLGSLDGTVVAKTVSLAASAQVQADISYELISIEAGARFEGSLRRSS